MKQKKKILFFLFLIFVMGFAQELKAVPINSDVALTPAEGVSILRSQVRFTNAESSSGKVRELNQLAIPPVLVYGLKKNIALFASLPVLVQEITEQTATGKDKTVRSGLADMTFLVKVRIVQKDELLKTTRIGLIGGVEMPTGKDRFSSDSFDPIFGSVYTYQTDRGEWDADLIYKWNTGSGVQSFDTLRYDLAYQHRVWPVEYPEKGIPTLWNIVAEANGSYSTQGNHLVFLSPGIQCVTKRWILESSIQLPVIRDLKGNNPEPDFVLTGGFRIQF